MVLPPRDEEAKIASLIANSKKVRPCTATYKGRCLLEKRADDIAKRAAATPWSGNSHTVSSALKHHLMSAEDKAIGYSAFKFPGTRGNIQRSESKIQEMIEITKVRLALRLAYAERLHDLNPWDFVKEGLIDPVVVFVKEEGHAGDKLQSQRWRLIWNVGEPDRPLTAWSHSDQDHADVFTFQDEAFGVATSLAVGTGHDDNSLKRTFRDIEEIKKRSPGGSVFCSDASGWDFSVSASTFWAGWRTKVSRADGGLHRRLTLLSGFFHTSWVILTGTRVYEAQRFGTTASGMSDTTRPRRLHDTVTLTSGHRRAQTYVSHNVYANSAESDMLNSRIRAD